MKSSTVVSHRAPPSAAAARGPAALPPETRAAANDESNATRQRAEEPLGPVWVITIAMAVFLGATALIMMFG
jgi:hypothetical protein